MNIQGKWKGYYEYGDGYALPYFGSKVEIEVIISLDKEGRLNGSVNEIQSPFSVPMKAEITGFIDQDLISFIKKYDAYPFINENNECEINSDRKLEIPHNGYIDIKNNAIYGTWSIEDPYEQDGHQYIDFLSGIWLLKRN
ncbi:hypothetical protein AAON49_11100 [Pseudotenacibaculum sp. MALMAid0570]|uniref:hypothetical protein n=1 Tax=Pseudotenacibaculum sp. MALMAid0570 TaxID=3143938 RepID=UPI0032DF0EF3